MELEHLDVVARGLGQALTPQERSNLELGLLKRRATEQLASVRFWGRLSGEIADYLIAVALLPGKDFPVKKFYFWQDPA
jgi:radial spoke head protein 9